MDTRLDKSLFDWYSLVNINLEWNHLVYIILSMLTIGLRYCSMFNPRNCTFFCFVIITWGWVGTKKWWLCHNIICHNKVGWLGDHWNLLDVINFAVFFFLRASLIYLLPRSCMPCQVMELFQGCYPKFTLSFKLLW